MLDVESAGKTSQISESLAEFAKFVEPQILNTHVTCGICGENFTNFTNFGSLSGNNHDVGSPYKIFIYFLFKSLFTIEKRSPGFRKLISTLLITPKNDKFMGILQRIITHSDPYYKLINLLTDFSSSL